MPAVSGRFVTGLRRPPVPARRIPGPETLKPVTFIPRTPVPATAISEPESREVRRPFSIDLPRLARGMAKAEPMLSRPRQEGRRGKSAGLQIFFVEVPSGPERTGVV